MKSTGIVRKVDQLGRIVMPVELRRAWDVSVGDSIKIFLEEDKVILKRHETDCMCAITGEVLDENIESTYVKGFYLSPRGAEILLQELQNSKQE